MKPGNPFLGKSYEHFLELCKATRMYYREDCRTWVQEAPTPNFNDVSQESSQWSHVYIESYSLCCL